MKELLEFGELSVVGQLIDASNMTLLAVVDGVQCIYKPVSGEAPLWDFPDGTLGRREVAAFLVSTLFPRPLVPLTVWRNEGPYGGGMCQVFVEQHVPEQPLVDVVPIGKTPSGFREILHARDGRGEHVVLIHQENVELRWLALLDAVINNADRKGGHILHVDGSIRGIDHGVTFHSEDKLRTVLWGWAGSPLTDEELAVLAALETTLDDLVGPWLAPEEVQACKRRVEKLMGNGLFPLPNPAWPSIPWPVF